MNNAVQVFRQLLIAFALVLNSISLFHSLSHSMRVRLVFFFRYANRTLVKQNIAVF